MNQSVRFYSSVLAIAWACSFNAHAAVTLQGGNDGSGDLSNISYGAGNAGTIFQLNALLYPGDNLATQQISTRVSTLPDLDFALSTSGDGSSTLQLDYTITNVGGAARSDLRLMAVLGVDGNPQTFNESVVETWGPAAAGEPSRRQTVVWDQTPDGGLNNIWKLSRGAVGPDGTAVPAACAAVTGCDAFVGLQWDLASLNPGESWVIRVGLSDQGQSLSARGFTITADPSGGYRNQLTFSGRAQVVPEPATWGLLAGGAALLAVLSRRRRA